MYEFESLIHEETNQDLELSSGIVRITEVRRSVFRLTSTAEEKSSP